MTQFEKNLKKDRSEATKITAYITELAERGLIETNSHRIRKQLSNHLGKVLELMTELGRHEEAIEFESSIMDAIRETEISFFIFGKTHEEYSNGWLED